MLDLIGYTPDINLSKYTILEPSFGNGDFLLEIQRRLIKSGKKFNFDASEIMSQNVYGCEIDDNKYNKCVEAIKELMPGYVPSKLKNEDFLYTVWDTKFDFIIGNPPYVRYENIPEEVRDLYKDRFYTFHYRCDLYVLFYEHSLKNLSISGHHCFVCSNRWLKNEYGKKLRALIASSFKLEFLIDIEEIAAFQESVLAYPSITLISVAGADDFTKVAYINDLSELKLPLKTKSKKISHLDNWDNLFRNDCLDNLSSIEGQGFKIGIGVATGADKLFISTELDKIVEGELLLPIINAKDLTGNEFRWKGLYVLNPYNSDGSVIDINKYPRAKQYLEKYRSILENRHIVKNGRVWYSLIDKIKPQLLYQPKILLPDISGNRVIFVDKGSFYPAHNIYYITGRTLTELELLAAILMSKFVKDQIGGIANKMNGGLPRWQSRSLKKIGIPLISKIPINLKHRLLEAYYKRDSYAINAIVENIVKLQNKTSKLDKKNFIPQSLFDYDFSVNIGSLNPSIL